jgi:hypothetical protein
MKLNLVVILILYGTHTFPQGISSLLDKSTNPGEVLVEFDNRSTLVKGDYYILEKWHTGDIAFKSGVLITDQLVNYDLEYDLLEVKFENMVKVVPLLKIDNFIIEGPDGQKRLFKPCSNFIYDNGVSLAGVCEVLDSNYFGLIIKYTSDIKEAAYVPALDMGTMADEIIIRQKYFLTIGNSSFPVPKKKKLLNDIYAPYEKNLADYIKDNKLNSKDKDDLRKILNYLNASHHQ